MIKKLIIISTITLLSACGASTPPPYQKDKSPEYRTDYNGAEGLLQQQKDQSYLMNKELTEKCDDAKINLAIAEKNKDNKETKNHQSLVNDYCI